MITLKSLNILPWNEKLESCTVYFEKRHIMSKKSNGLTENQNVSGVNAKMHKNLINLHSKSLDR